MIHPVVSIGIGSYNNELYIEELLDSIRLQSYSAIELIVIDDCSTDNSVTVIEKWIAKTGYPVIFIKREKNQGLVRTYSACTQLATGDYVSLVGSDDILDPDFVAATVAEFNRRGPRCGGIYTDCRLIDAQGVEIAPSFMRYFNPSYAESPPEGNLIVALLRGLYLPTVTTTVRREALIAVGPHDESLFSEDLDMWLRISRLFDFAYMSGNFGAYRVHRLSAVHTNRSALNETYFKIYRKGYFEGPDEWAAARYNLANHAEHYYASGGRYASINLLFAFKETKIMKLALFYLLSIMRIKYSSFIGLIKRFH
ncbi:glycosyltransferase [Hymenobacter sp. ISL-91]|nr:glycosyltransferase [Hymenobacter sp. ISL-91]